MQPVIHELTIYSSLSRGKEPYSQSLCLCALLVHYFFPVNNETGLSLYQYYRAQRMSKSGLCGLDALDSMELLLSKKGKINEAENCESDLSFGLFTLSM